MKKLAILVGAAALTLAGAASAQGYGYQSNDEAYRAYTQNYQPRNTACERQRDNDKLAGGLVGAVAGGLIGGAIGNNIDNDDHYRRGYRGYGRGYGRGYRRGHYRRHHRSNDNSGEVAVGAILGAVVGGIAGSNLAESSSRDCQTYAAPQPVNRNYGYSNPQPTNVYRGTAPSYPATYPATTTRTVQTYPVSQPRTVTTYPSQPVTRTTTYPSETIYGGPECRTVYRETRLPNGEVLRDPVEACRNGSSDEWVIQGTAARY